MVRAAAALLGFILLAAVPEAPTAASLTPAPGPERAALASAVQPVAAAVTAPTGGDITGLVTADGGRDDIVLKGGDYTITIPASGPRVQEAPELPATPETIYHGVISGTGTLTIKPPAGGRGSLVMTGLSTWSLPHDRLRSWSNKQPFARYQYDGVTLNGGVSPWDVDVLHGGTNAPVLTIAKGAVVNLDDLDGGRANIESYVGAGGRSAGAYNMDHIQVDGALVFTNNHHSPYESTIGPLSGSGDFINHQGGFRMSGVSTISGHVLMYGANINGAWAMGELTGVSKIYDALDLAYGATPETIAPAGQTGSSTGVEVVPQTIYECCYGNAVYNIGAGEVRFTGEYSYSDSQDQLRPALSNPKLNYVAFPKGNSQRIVDLGRGITTFGDGSNANFWLPSGWGNAYIGTHQAYALGFDYNGTVRMNVPINKATAVDGLNLFVQGTPGNRVIVTQPLYYHGFTRIDPKAVLQLGDGTRGNKNADYRFYNKQISGMDTGVYSTSSGSGRVLTADVAPGATGDRIIDNGTLVVANVAGAYSGVGALSLSDISGRGGLQQHGPATLTLLSHMSYRGPTTVSGGTLVLARSRRGAASLTASSGVSLTGRSARLDLSAVGPQKLAGLAGVAGSRVDLGGHPLTLTLGVDKGSTFAGSVTDGGAHPGHGGGLVLAGAGRFTLDGKITAAGAVKVRSGDLELGAAGPSTQPQVATVAGPVSVSRAGTLGVAAGSVGSLASSGGVQLDGPLAVRRDLTQTSTGTLSVNLDGRGAGPRITTGGQVTLGGRLRLIGTPAPTSRLTLVDNRGRFPVSGGFAGLGEGGRVSTPSGAMRVTYRGGDGNDVVLIPAGSPAAVLAGGLIDGRVDHLGGPRLLLGGTLLLLAGLIFFWRRRHRRHSLPTTQDPPLARS